jgi:hypothetical protein
MIIISGPVKSVDYHPDVSEPTAAYSAYLSWPWYAIAMSKHRLRPRLTCVLFSRG